MEGRKVVVIGSGVGGSGVAAILQHRGYDVTVLEKNNFYGVSATASSVTASS